MKSRMDVLSLMIIVFILMTAPIMAQDEPLISGQYQLTHDGLTRTYHIAVPASQPEHLLIALHPIASSGEAMAVISGLDALTESGYVVAYPDSAGLYWDDGRSTANVPPANGTIDDVGYISALIATLTESFDIPADEIYLTGMGNGGTMAMRLTCELPEQFASVAIVSSLMWEFQAEACPAEASTPTNIIFIYGDADHVYHRNGRNIETQNGWFTILGANQTRDLWATRNACNLDDLQTISQTQLSIYTNCGNATRTAFLTIHNGGSLWYSTESSINHFGISATQVIADFFAGDDDGQSAIVTNASNEIPRTFIVYVPNSYDPTQPTPVVFLLHGRGGSGFQQAYTSDMNTIADREGFIAIYPDGYDPDLVDATWNYGEGIDLYQSGPRNEEAFFAALLQDLGSHLNIDAQRIYATGYSNGGFMTQRLGCTSESMFAAFASVAATAPFGVGEWCNGTPPVPMMFIHGTADAIVPWNGKAVRYTPTNTNIYITAPMDQTMGFWADHNGCAIDFTTQDFTNNDPDSSAVLLTFEDCPEDAPLLLIAVYDGGHVWHGVRDFDIPILGEVNMDFNASEVIWHFFQQFTLENRIANDEPLVVIQ